MELTRLIDQPWFREIRRPSRYLGNEPNAVRKPRGSVELRAGLAFPDVYEVGMSHQGLKILYHMLNNRPWLAAERIFCPWVDMESALRRHGRPLETLESGTPAAELDMVGFSLQHELCYTNVLTMLDLAGLPFTASERDERHPLVVAGGPACFNPEPIAEVFDAVMLGDGEEGALEMCRVLRRARSGGRRDRGDILLALAGIPGIYVPLLFSPRYREDGRLQAMDNLIPGYGPVRKALIPDLGASPFPAEQVVPYAEPVHDRLSVEIARGCTRGCRFCQAGMIYRPVRERDPESLLRHVDDGLRRTGYEEVSLLSLSSGDYSGIGPLLHTLMDRQSGNKVAVSLPSLRMDSLDSAWFEEIKRVRKTGFTLAPEAGSDRLRRVINKNLTNEAILRTAGAVYSAGWNLIKLYFMIGLPGETEDDLQDLMDLSRSVVRLSGSGGKRPKLHVSVATFVPKSHTPFMWHPQITLEESRRRIGAVQEGLRDRRIRVKWNNPEMSWLEGIFSRGDRRLLGCLIRAWSKGARFDAWSEQFRPELWREALVESGLDPAFYLQRERGLEEILPWDHIDSGVGRAFLLRERRRAEEESPTPDCRERCLECGVCDHRRVDPVIHAGKHAEEERPERKPESPEVSERSYLMVYTKIDTAAFLGHLEMVKAFSRALRRARLLPAHTGGYHPTPKLSFMTALPVGTESLCECLRAALLDPPPPPEAMERLNTELPPGLKIASAEDITGKRAPGPILESHFRITLPQGTVDPRAVEAFMDSEEHPVVKETAKGRRTVDARALVKSVRPLSEDTLDMVLRPPPGPTLKPSEVLQEILGLDPGLATGLKILKTKQVLG